LSLVKEGWLNHIYIGLYTPRNLCRIVQISGCYFSSFPYYMSTGFSGNFGFHLPKNLAFDQISTVTLYRTANFEILTYISVNPPLSLLQLLLYVNILLYKFLL
jgi:hypothetical protein